MIPNNYLEKSTRTKKSILVISISLFSVALVTLYFFVQNQAILKAIQLFIGGMIGLIVLQFPMLGLGLILASTTVADALPQIPLLSSVIPLIGIITFLGFISNKKYRNAIKPNLSKVELLGLIFVFWLIISNPNASILGKTRSWVLTFIQLLMMLWLARQFIRTKSDHQTIMIILVIGILISAVVAIIQVGSLSNLNIENRAEGLSGGANTAARYFLYGIILLFYLESESKNSQLIRIVEIFCIALLAIALIFTESRSGLILLIIFAFLQLLPMFSKKKKSVLLIIILLATIFFLIGKTALSTLQFNNVIGSIINGSDTVGYRYTLWNAGIKMTFDHPFIGVGIGKFGDYLPYYWPVSKTILANTAHNTYIEVLAETGIIGFIIFASLLVASFLKYIKNIKESNKPSASIYTTWLIILIVLLIGSFTKGDTIDKFLWFLLGLDIQSIKSIRPKNRSEESLKDLVI